MVTGTKTSIPAQEQVHYAHATCEHLMELRQKKAAAVKQEQFLAAGQLRSQEVALLDKLQQQQNNFTGTFEELCSPFKKGKHGDQFVCYPMAYMASPKPLGGPLEGSVLAQVMFLPRARQYRREELLAFL